MHDRITTRQRSPARRRLFHAVRDALRDDAVQQLAAGGLGLAMALYLQRGNTPGELLTWRFATWAALGALGGGILGGAVRHWVRR